MFLFVSHLLAWKVGFNYIFEATVIPQQTQLDDMVAELLPLHGLISINVNLFEEIDQRKGEILLQLGVLIIVLEVLQHDWDKLIQQ